MPTPWSGPVSRLGLVNNCPTPNNRNTVSRFNYPAVWVTPVVESVILPAHAGFSCGELEPFDKNNDRHTSALGSCANDNCISIVACVVDECIEIDYDS